MRAFVALHPPEPVVEALLAVQAALPFGRPADPEQLHLTLAFLGEQPDDLVEAAHWALSDLRAPALTLRLGGLGVWGERTPGALWAGVREEGPLRALRSRVLSALYGAGIPLERRRFRPHVTLARLGPLGPEEDARLARALARWDAFPCPPWEVRDMGLWRSTLRRGGAVHDELARYPLQGVPA